MKVFRCLDHSHPFSNLQRKRFSSTRPSPIKPEAYMLYRIVSFSFNPESNFPWHKICVTGKQNSLTNYKKKNGSQTCLPLEFLKCLKMQLLRLFENHKNLKIRKSGQNWHFYLSIKQLITLKIVINSRLSGKFLEMQP